MIVQSTNNCTFGAKNTYLVKAEKSLSKDDKLKFLSYHSEAKAKCHYLKYLSGIDKAEFLLDTEDKGLKRIYKATKVLSNILYHKIASWYYISDAYKLYPKRFE